MRHVRRCAYKGGQHHSHDHQDVDMAFDAFKGQVLPKLDRQRDKLNGLLRAVDIMQPKIAVSRSKHESIKYSETVLGQVKAELSTAQDRLKNFLKLSKVKKHSRRGEVLLKKNKLLSGLSCIEEAVQSSTSKLQEPNPWQCRLSCDSPATVGERATAILDVVSFQSVSIAVSLKSLQCVLISDATTVSVECNIEESQGRQGSYNITYQPVTEGRYQLSIKIKNVHVRGSPCVVLAEPPVSEEKSYVEKRHRAGHHPISARKKSTSIGQERISVLADLPRLREPPYPETPREQPLSNWEVCTGILFYLVLGVLCCRYGFWSVIIGFWYGFWFVVIGLCNVFVFLCVLSIHCLLLDWLLGFISKHFTCLLCIFFSSSFYYVVWKTIVE